MGHNEPDLARHPLVAHLERKSYKQCKWAFNNRNDHFVRGHISNKNGIVAAQSLYSEQNQQLVTLVTLGSNVCGHAGIVHGGLIAALFDDLMGEMFYDTSNGNYRGVTASLKIDFRKPMHSNQTIVFVTKLVSKVGRKSIIQSNAHVYSDGDGVNVDECETMPIYAQAEALFLMLKSDWEMLNKV